MSAEMIARGTPAVLLLADGTLFYGRAFGAGGEVCAEVVFNTSLTGYQEVLTDPSYCGQMVLMTYPQIGNYGVNDEDIESRRCFLSAFIVKEYCPYPSNWRSRGEMAELLARDGVIGLEGIDTRALTRHIRTAGAMPAILSTEDFAPESLRAKLERWPGIVGVNLVDGVSSERTYEWRQRGWNLERGYCEEGPADCRVVVYDFGIKYNILRRLREAGCSVTVVPAATPAEDILALKPDGLFLSNGPGDPAAWAGAPPLLGGGPRRGQETGRPSAALRYLSGSPDSRSGSGRADLQAQVRSSRQQPSGYGSDHGRGRDYLAEPWFLR